MFVKRACISVLLLIFAGVAAAQTEGFIYTRPTCVPPDGAQNLLNYIQGPDPILLQNGDVAIMVNAGKCCPGPWEGVFSLIYPAAGRAATPRFSGIWASNNFGTEPARNEHEVGFPSAIFYNNKWRIAYTATFNVSRNRDRVGRLDLDNLTYQAQTTQVTNQWIKPINQNCWPLGGSHCPNRGSGILGTFVLHPNDDLFVYHKDPACAQSWVRHKIDSNMTVVNPSGDGCISLGGPIPTWLSDIARGADGKLYLLLTSRHPTGEDNGEAIEEWVSTGSASTIGLSWSRTGRRWVRPSHDTPGYTYWVWDAGYLKDENRQIVEPRVIVSQISEGRTFQEINDVTLGRWYLYYWAEAGASLPPTFGGPASSCSFEGYHEVADCTAVSGWAWDPMFPDSPISVDIYDGSTRIATVAADLYRGDIGKGDGRHGFSWPVPASLKNNAAHSITVKYAATQTALPASPKTITCAPPATTYELRVTKTGAGSGTVSSNPAGINCGPDCTENYSPSTIVNLTAAPASGSAFGSWGGDADCNDGSVTMNVARNCTATFNTVSSTNLAPGKLTFQSSNYNGISAHGSQVAADGNTDGNYFSGTVTHTGLDAQAWWQVDLGSVSSIDQIKVWNRSDCCPERLSNFHVLVSNTLFTSTDLTTTLNQPGVLNYPIAGTAGRPSVIPIGQTGRYVRVQLANSNYLSIAEVEVLGTPGTPPSDTVWVEDNTPSGATTFGDNGDGWNWINFSTPPGPYWGSHAHQSNLYSGMHQHYFAGATQTLTVNAGNVLFAYVYLDPSNPPSEVMLQWNDGTWEHRAYWGADLITSWGANGTTSRRYMGTLPPAGRWVRLEVAASTVGLENKTLHGMAYTLVGGRATWDHAGKQP